MLLSLNDIWAIWRWFHSSKEVLNHKLSSGRISCLGMSLYKIWYSDANDKFFLFLSSRIVMKKRKEILLPSSQNKAKNLSGSYVNFVNDLVSVTFVVLDTSSLCKLRLCPFLNFFSLVDNLWVMTDFRFWLFLHRIIHTSKEDLLNSWIYESRLRLDSF